ncbi:nucleotidyltransferase family protein [Allorhizocola rhizosphaerae]|uniref:nucleotidyltransferase family protein n=1 Tax=Allorhizocola rhizosphaerae TaxID=1872709 RepID=UPI0013C31B1C|nr:nucleotidyltransferase family protein [Allorhizocola rhizosphaerae]
MIGSEALRGLMCRRGVPESVDDATLLALARDPAHKLAATLLSAWAAEGRALPVRQREELDNHRSRIERYERAWSSIVDAAPQAYVVKGPSIAAHYPAHLVRAAGDLDVVCRRADDLWAVAVRLVEQGWEVAATTVQLSERDGLDILLQLQQPPDNALGVPYVVDLTTADVATSLRTRAHQLSNRDTSPLATSAIALVAERWERRFNSRDVLDLYLLERAATPQDMAALRIGLAESGLGRAYRQLTRAVDRSGLVSEHRARLDAPSRVDIRRVADRTRRWMHPVRALGYLAATTVEDERGPLVDRIGQLVHERAGARRLLSLGLPLFGVPLSHDPAGVGLRLTDQGGQLVAHTPVGSFMLVGAACRAEWLPQEVAA